MTKTCEHCQKQFEVITSNNANRFCSSKCYGSNLRGKPWCKVRRERFRPKVRIESARFPKECRECGKQFRVKWYRVDEAKFCSRRCHYDHRNHGITPANERVRKSAAYRAWRTLVFDRDNYTCQFCGKRGVKLHADHIKQFAYHPELRLDVSNGRTLCLECHRKTETYAAKPKATKVA